MERNVISDDFGAEWPTLRLVGDARFDDLRSRRYRRSLTYRAGDYVSYATTTSHYRTLTEPVREAALADVAAVIDAHGGVMTIVRYTDLALARRIR
jgi:hypothetical protein